MRSCTGPGVEGAEQKAARVYQLRIGTKVAASQLILTTSGASYCSLSGAS